MGPQQFQEQPRSQQSNNIQFNQIQQPRRPLNADPRRRRPTQPQPQQQQFQQPQQQQQFQQPQQFQQFQGFPDKQFQQFQQPQQQQQQQFQSQVSAQDSAHLRQAQAQIQEAVRLQNCLANPNVAGC